MTNTTNPVIPYIEGDGIGPEIWQATKKVVDAAVHSAYQGKRKINWLEILAGEKAYNQTGTWLPDVTLEAIRKHKIA
ncbi:MAG: isocitrate/isopropylmalate family dehydrogenase, partial [Enterococcus viikkiensis]